MQIGQRQPSPAGRQGSRRILQIALLILALLITRIPQRLFAEIAQKISGGQYELVSLWGSTGKHAGQFTNPFGIAVDAQGHVYVTDISAPHVKVFTEDGKFLKAWGNDGIGPGELQKATGIAVDHQGRVYIADTFNGVRVFSPDGQYLFGWQVQNHYDPGPPFNMAWAIAISASGNVYVVEPGNIVFEYTSKGKFIRQWSIASDGDGQYTFLCGVAVDSPGNIYVADSENNRIQKFSPDGKFIAKWATGNHRSDPFGIAVDAEGNLFVSDSHKRCITKYTNNGTLITRWYVDDLKDIFCMFDMPLRGLAVDRNGSILAINGRVFRYQKRNR